MEPVNSSSEFVAEEEEELSFLKNFFLDDPEEVAAEEKWRRREQQDAAHRKSLREKKEKRDAIRKIFSTKPAPPLESLRGLLRYRYSTSTKNVVKEAAAAAPSSPEEEECCVDLEPLFYDEAETVAEYAAGAEKREQKERKAEQAARKKAMRLLRLKFHYSVLDSICEYDHASGRRHHTRFHYVDLSTFNLDEESPLGPMRHTGEAFHLDGTVCRRGQERFLLFHSVNVLSVKITRSDVGFPINVYGTVIARDTIDMKCVYLFRRDRNNCQLINSEDDLLLLTGPKRGLALRCDIYFEANLKVKAEEQGQKDRHLSNGFVTVRDPPPRLPWDKMMMVETESLDTRLSVVEVAFLLVPRAVEATIAVEVMEGEFHGKITARTSTIRHGAMLLHDSSEVAGVANCPDGGGNKRLLRMLRPTVAVFPKELLEITAVTRTGGGAGEVEVTSVNFTPRASGVDEVELTCGSSKMLVKVCWSIIACIPFMEGLHAP